MTIVFLIDQVLDERNYERFGIDTWRSRGWRVQVWDLTALAHPAVWAGFCESGRALRGFEGYMQVQTPADLQRLFASSASVDYYVDFGGESIAAARVKLHLARRRAIRIVCAVATVPEKEVLVGTTPGLRNKVLRVVRGSPAQSWVWLSTVVRDRLLRRIAPPGIVVASGSESLRRFAKWRDAETVRAHNLDYDIYLKLRQQPHRSGPRFAVFVDQDLCFHPDYTYDNISVYATPNEYFPALRRGFQRVAAEFDVTVRVAAHPRAGYDAATGASFGGAEVVRGMTPELIRDCELVMGHWSGVLQLAVLFHKPVVFFTTNQLRRAATGPTLDLFAEALGKSAVNLDDDLDGIDWARELAIDDDAYRAFRERYIKMPDSPDRSHWDIVIDEIERRGQRRQAS
jgi:hypothetical protein